MCSAAITCGMPLPCAPGNRRWVISTESASPAGQMTKASSGWNAITRRKSATARSARLANRIAISATRIAPAQNTTCRDPVAGARARAPCARGSSVAGSGPKGGRGGGAAARDRRRGDRRLVHRAGVASCPRPVHRPPAAGCFHGACSHSVLDDPPGTRHCPLERTGNTYDACRPPCATIPNRLPSHPDWDAPPEENLPVRRVHRGRGAVTNPANRYDGQSGHAVR